MLVLFELFKKGTNYNKFLCHFIDGFQDTLQVDSEGVMLCLFQQLKYNQFTRTKLIE
jgi:hypothetical protein